LPAKLGSRNPIADKFTAVRGGFVAKLLQRYSQTYCVANAYTAKSRLKITLFVADYDKQEAQYLHKVSYYGFQAPRRPPDRNGKPTRGQKLQIWARQYFLNRVSIVFAIFLVTSRSYISIHSIQFTRAFQPSTAS